MGRRGPKPKPKAIRIFEGDPGNLLASRHEGEFEPPKFNTCPPAPDCLRGPTAKRIWERIAPVLHASGVLTQLDVEAFEVYCDAVEDYRRQKEYIKEHGDTYTNQKTGAMLRRPEAELMNRAKETIRQFAALFGLSPVARVGLKGGPATPPAADGKGLESMAL